MEMAGGSVYCQIIVFVDAGFIFKNISISSYKICSELLWQTCPVINHFQVIFKLL